MSLHDSVKASVNDLVTDYQVFHSTLRDVIQQAQMSQIPLSHDHVTHLLLSRGRYHIDNLMRHVGSDYFRLITVSAMVRAAKVNGYNIKEDSLRQFLGQRHSETRDNIEAQMRRDLNKAYQTYQRGRLADYTQMDFKYRDSLGRARDAEGYIRVEATWMFFDAWNTGMVFVLRATNQTKAKVERPGHERHGKEFNLDEYEDKKDRWFHPQANALVMPVSPV